MKINYLFLTFLILILSFINITLKAEAEWTILVYMAADNNLSQSAFKDINEMESVEYDDSVNVIVQIDPNDNLSYPPYFSECRRYLIEHDQNTDSLGSTLLENLGEINSSNPNQLSSFVNWGFETYKSKKKLLIIWDHGNGWRKDSDVKSVCYDNSHNDRMSVGEGELSRAVYNFNHEIDIVVFDACLMQMAEVIGEINHKCKIVMGCEMDVPSDGIFYGDYNWHADSKYGLINYIANNSTVSHTIFAKEIVSRYIGAYVAGVQVGGNTSMSAVDCNKFIEFFIPEFNKFSYQFADTIYYNLLHSVYDDCEPLNSEKSIDIWQFFNNLAEAGTGEISSEALKVKDAIDSTIIKSSAYFNNNIDEELGRFSINFPKYVENFSNWELYDNLKLVKESRWDRFIAFYHKGYPQSQISPIIENFNAFNKGKYLQFSWNAKAPSFINYEIHFKNSEVSEFEELISGEGFNYFDTTFATGVYDFKLIAKDEFLNEQDSTIAINVKDNIVFAFYPNPYKSSQYQKCYFLCSLNTSQKSKIYIYNQAGDIVDIILINSPENSIVKIEYDATKLASGIYYCLLNSGESVRKIRVAIIN